MQYFRFLPDPAKLRKEARWSGVSSDGTFKMRVGYEVNAAADIIRRNQSVPYFLNTLPFEISIGARRAMDETWDSRF